MRVIKTSVVDGVALVTLDDPERRNAISERMSRQIASTFDGLERDSGVGAVVITGAPPAFCSGADLAALEGARGRRLRAIYEAFLRIGRSPLPTVAAVNGAAVGAGLNMALVCDLRIAARSASFDSRFLELSLHPGGGHTWMLRQMVGPQTLAAMTLFGQRLGGEEAARRGLVWSCVEDEDLVDEALAVAARAASLSRRLVCELKATLRELPSIHMHGEAVERELEPQLRSVGDKAFQEALAARQKCRAEK